MTINPIFQVSNGMRGYYAIVYDENTSECIQTGIGSYETYKEALLEAAEWAYCEMHVRQYEKLIEEYNNL